MSGKFKFQGQDSDLEYLFWQCETHIALSEKKPSLEGFCLKNKKSNSYNFKIIQTKL